MSKYSFKKEIDLFASKDAYWEDYLTFISDLWFCECCGKWKNCSSKIFIQSFPREIPKLQNKKLYERALADEYVNNISSRYLKNDKFRS